ncbi:alpha/beta hydrolase [Alteromonadaceae bacterium M269]|nr:alpha/beta hydrolase [Alteromonadaceae bacterium M269]
MQEISFQLSHRRINGLAFGDPTKPLIVALHGWLDNAASFIPLSEHLSDYYLVAIDFVGHGHSEHRSPDAHYHQMDFVQDLHEIVESQMWDDFILLGHSMGGIVGSLYASSFPEKVTKFISIEAFGPITKEAEVSAQQLRDSIESRIRLRDRSAKHPTSFSQAVQARINAGYMEPSSAELLVERNLSKQDDILKWRTDRRLRTISSVRLTHSQAEFFMRNLTMPVMVIHGTKGFDQVRGFVESRQEWVKDLTIENCPGGHHLHMDEPQPVSQVISEFLES